VSRVSSNVRKRKPERRLNSLLVRYKERFIGRQVQFQEPIKTRDSASGNVREHKFKSWHLYPTRRPLRNVVYSTVRQ